MPACPTFGTPLRRSYARPRQVSNASSARWRCVSMMEVRRRAMAITLTPPTTKTKTLHRADPDFLPIHGVDHVEFWVGNAYQAAQSYRTMFGFDVIADAGPETGI